ncbi:hypothetical protein SAMN05216267_10586 [Actinacidiphila rubida]|uniref:Uncharacterized protein n=1 Tax=Actinacidiphila rubida TaxID=310780 RepID=A0A1H8TSM1_9ACTN|nr:hypothetical protein SAMN05216267_10586 [Actinacidiphila rubida]
MPVQRSYLLRDRRLELGYESGLVVTVRMRSDHGADYLFDEQWITAGGSEEPTSLRIRHVAEPVPCDGRHFWSAKWPELLVHHSNRFVIGEVVECLVTAGQYPGDG